MMSLTVPAELNLQTLMDQYFFNRNYQSFPVVEGDRPIGMVTLNQVKQIPQDQWSARTVKDIMRPIEQGISVSPQEDMMNVLTKMQETQSRRLLVTDNGFLAGILSATDLANWLQRKQEFGEDVPRRSGFITQSTQGIQSGSA
jgi:predicted transcriptional regulator